MMPITALSLEDAPPQLMEIPQPPKQLRICGAPLPKDGLYLAVVGSRKYTQYGKDVCKKILSELVGTNVIIVSGLALGMDALAHKAALDVGLRTLAIPGSGLSPKVLAPRSNFPLAQQILKQGGTLLSEFDDETRAAIYTFPQRNRIMAGISRGVLIIEAGERSGTLITSRLATEYNKDVFTVPGSIFSQTSSGPHMLIRMGAVPVTSGGDILAHWNMEKGGTEEARRTLFDACTDEEQKVLAHLVEPLPKEILLDKTELPISELNSLLSIMEIKGLIQETGGYIRSMIV